MSEPATLRHSLENAHVECWLNPSGYRYFSGKQLERLPPHLWEQLRQRLQSIYRDATGEEQATFIIEEPRP